MTDNQPQATKKTMLDEYSQVEFSSSIRQRGRSETGGLSKSMNLNASSSFDPYAPNDTVSPPSLFDDRSIDSGQAYLEMEIEEQAPSTKKELPPRPNSMEPIKTDSGLLLTHRLSPPVQKPRPARPGANTDFFRKKQSNNFEMDQGHPSWGNSFPLGGGKHSMLMLHARRLSRLWIIIFSIVIFVTGAVIHSFRHSEASNDNSTIPVYQQAADDRQGGHQPFTYNTIGEGELENVILLPIEEGEEYNPARQLDRSHNKDSKNVIHAHDLNLNHRRQLMDLRGEFDSWILEHGKIYHTAEEKERRFHVWSDNHHKTIEKNRKHGPCSLTKQPVFGSNHLKDLTSDEFKSMYLTGYKGPKTDEIEKRPTNVRKMSKNSGKAMDPQRTSNMHPDVLQQINKHRAAKGHRLLQQQPVLQATSNPNCAWYDVSCLLRWLWQSAGVQFGSIVGTMEPMYDADAYPNSVDWRDNGAITEVRSQGDCGACWAITAVETIESAYYLSNGDLYDLSEAEIITCDDTCDMCSGGWPQNAYEWTMDHGGLPLYQSFPYDGSTLLEMTSGIEGTSDNWDEDSVKEYRQQVCPSSYGNSGSGSNDYYDNGEENDNYGDYSSQGRYGNIQGYGYATDRCICYSDGSGCDCDEQNEGMAVANVASHGPAVVCLEASLWQDYGGGIITTESGCGSAFLDMNHCVQVVGYAFTDGSEQNEEADYNNGNGSGSGSGGSGSGSKDETQREGYWIVRNQWSNSWGMNGYAYVAMGANTCGILNDMTQAW